MTDELKPMTDERLEQIKAWSVNCVCAAHPCPHSIAHELLAELARLRQPAPVPDDVERRAMWPRWWASCTTGCCEWSWTTRRKQLEQDAEQQLHSHIEECHPNGGTGHVYQVGILAETEQLRQQLERAEQYGRTEFGIEQELRRERDELAGKLLDKDKEILRLQKVESDQIARAESGELMGEREPSVWRLFKHKKNCTWATELPTGAGYCGCNCGLDNLLIELEDFELVGSD